MDDGESDVVSGGLNSMRTVNRVENKFFVCLLSVALYQNFYSKGSGPQNFYHGRFLQSIDLDQAGE